MIGKNRHDQCYNMKERTSTISQLRKRDCVSNLSQKEN
uniref:Uncharacterized protein n=1 Tax=Rhizophora mucronata TaxID=61149 RepID=A0A2P2QIR8_RHIMU